MLGTIIAVATFVLFYLMTAFTLSWGTRPVGAGPLPAGLGYSQGQFLVVQLVGVVFFGLTIPDLRPVVGSLLAPAGPDPDDDRHPDLRPVLFDAADRGPRRRIRLLDHRPGFDGLHLRPDRRGTCRPFPTAVRYTGASMTFNLGGIVGASLAPYIATWLASNYGLGYVGYYLALAAVLSLIGILLSGNDEV